MVKLAHHIDWPSKLPSKAGEGTSSEKPYSRKVDLIANGKPRRTLAELFEPRATSSSLSSSSPSSSSLSTLSSLSSSSKTPSSGPAPLLLSSTTAHVTFEEKLPGVQHKQSTWSSELGDGIKRSSSARKVADSSRHESTHSQLPSKKTSKSGPLVWSTPSGSPSKPESKTPSTNANILEQNGWNSPAKPSNGHSNGKPSRGSSSSEQQQRTPSANSIISQKNNISPLMRFYEHNQKNFLMKSFDTVENLKNPSRFRQIESISPVEKNPEVDYNVQKLQGTPTKGKKLRKGLFAMLTDANSTKHSGGELRESESPRKQVSGNLGKSTKLSGSETPNSVSLSSNKVSSNLEKHGGMGELKTLTVEIPEKMVGLAWLGQEPRLLLQGTYKFPSEGFMLEQVVSERSSYVKHGNLHRVWIREGHLGVAWVDGKAVLLEAGVSVHACPSDRFSYITTDDKMVLEKEFVLGPFRVVTVHDSEVGIKFCNRQPQILYSGRHCLSISKLEVFAGFESLLRRQSTVNEASAMSSDNVPVSTNASVEWQIKAEDAAAARVANVTDVEGAVCGKVRRAFNLVVWEMNSQDMKLQLTGGIDKANLQYVCTTNTEPHPFLKSLSSSISKECMDLFEEGWTITIWDLQLSHLVISSEVQTAQG